MSTVLNQDQPSDDIFMENAHVAAGLLVTSSDLLPKHAPRLLVASPDLTSHRRTFTTHLVAKLHQLQLHASHTIG